MTETRWQSIEARLLQLKEEINVRFDQVITLLNNHSGGEKQKAVMEEGSPQLTPHTAVSLRTERSVRQQSQTSSAMEEKQKAVVEEGSTPVTPVTLKSERCNHRNFQSKVVQVSSVENSLRTESKSDTLYQLLTVQAERNQMKEIAVDDSSFQVTSREASAKFIPVSPSIALQILPFNKPTVTFQLLEITGEPPPPIPLLVSMNPLPLFNAHKLFDLMSDLTVFLSNTLIQDYFSHDPYYRSFLSEIPPSRPPSQPPDIFSKHENPLTHSPTHPLTHSPQFTLSSPLLRKLQPQLSHSMCQLKLDFPLFSFINSHCFLSQVEMRFEGPHKIQVIMLPMNLVSSFKCMIAPAHYGFVMATCFVLGLSSGVYLKLHIHETVGIWPTREWAIENEEFQREVGKHMGMSSQFAIPNIRAGNAVPNGASSGVYESLEFRTRGSDDKCVVKAVVSVTRVIGYVLIGMDQTEQTSIDSYMVQQLDGAVDEWDWCKQKLGVNALLVVSPTDYKVGASGKKMFHYKHLTNLAGNQSLVWLALICKVSNIDSHDGNKLAKEEFMILHVGAHSFKEAWKIAAETHYYLQTVIKKRYGQVATYVGDEGDPAPTIRGKGLVIANDSYMGKFVTGEKLASDNSTAILLRILGVAEQAIRLLFGEARILVGGLGKKKVTTILKILNLQYLAV